jgi:hypothetical protein
VIVAIINRKAKNFGMFSASSAQSNPGSDLEQFPEKALVASISG